MTDTSEPTRESEQKQSTETPFADFTDDDDTNTDPTVTVPNSAEGDLLFDILSHLDSGNDTTPGLFQFLQGQFVAAGAFEMASSWQHGVDGGVMSHTLQNSKEFLMTGFNIKAAPIIAPFPPWLQLPNTLARM